MFRRRYLRSRNRKREPTPSVWRRVAFGVGVCIFFGICVAVVWYGTRIPALTITSVSVDGGETVPHETIRDTLESALRESYFTLIPYRFSFLYPHDALVASVQAIPRVKDVSISRSSKNELLVTFTEYVPYALWCTQSEHDAPCYFLDETGYAFASCPRLDGGSLVRHIFEGVSDLEKKQVFERTKFNETHIFLERLLRERALRITDVFYTKDGDVRLTVNGGGEIVLRNDGKFDTVIENLTSVLSTDEFKHLEPGNFQYIDLRFGNKIFVNEEPVPVTSTTTVDETATST